MTQYRIRYQTLEFGTTDIHLRTLRDKQEFSDNRGEAEALGISSAHWSLFGVVWPSNIVLSHYLYDYDLANKRVLEVGCGIGLASLLMNRLGADITATDYHPEAEGFLLLNTQLNGDTPIPFLRTGWADGNTSLGVFDLIVGSDLLYEQEHAELLSTFIERHLKPTGEVIIVDPGRRHHTAFTRNMRALGFSFSQSKPDTSAYLDSPLKARIFTYER